MLGCVQYPAFASGYSEIQQLGGGVVFFFFFGFVSFGPEFAPIVNIQSYF